MDSHIRISGSDFDQFILGNLTHCQNGGSYLYLLTLVLSPVYRWLSCDDKGYLELVDFFFFFLKKFIYLRLELNVLASYYLFF